MKVEDLNALRFILQDDLYLLSGDKHSYDTNIPQGYNKTLLVETKPVSFNYLGLNKKNFLILVHYPKHEFIPDDHLAALESVLSRKGHNREDVAILNTSKIDTEYESLIAYFKPQTLVILGRESMPANISQPEFNVCKKHDGIDLLYTFSFDAMMANIDNKKAFWDQMKKI